MLTSTLVPTILFVADFIAFTCLFVTILVKLGIPNNLSITYYQFERKLRWFFPAVNLFLCVTGGPYWIYLTSRASNWTAHLWPVALLAVISMVLVAASFDYQASPARKKFHYACAWTACICIIIWINTVGIRIGWLGICILSAFVLAGVLTKTMKSCPLFWLEMAAFYALVATLLALTLIPSLL